MWPAAEKLHVHLPSSVSVCHFAWRVFSIQLAALRVCVCRNVVVQAKKHGPLLWDDTLITESSLAFAQQLQSWHPVLWCDLPSHHLQCKPIAGQQVCLHCVQQAIMQISFTLVSKWCISSRPD